MKLNSGENFNSHFTPIYKSDLLCLSLPPTSLVSSKSHLTFAILQHQNHLPTLQLQTTTPKETHHTTEPSQIPTTKNYRHHYHHHYKKLKHFKEKDAFPSTLPIHTKNPRSIYKDIKRFARQDKLKEALTILDYVDQQGIPVNATTFSALIAACIRTKSLQHGFENNEFLRTKLVQMYTSCGALEEANQIFNELLCNSVYPWNALLRGSMIAGKKHYLDVLKAYTEMRALGV
ncbi:hypothetical protein AHAS_Ahas15G0222600 [Arachis hypogaea]